MNNKFSEWLFVSDIDSTLNNKLMRLPKVNKLAVDKFVSDGGVFTLCSGRNLQSLSIHYKKLGIETPAIFLNGAGIYDFKSESFLDYNPITEDGEKIILDTLANTKGIQLTIYAPEIIYRATKKCLYGYLISKFDGLNCALCESVSDLPRGIWGKVTFFGTNRKIKELNKFFKNEKNKEIFDCCITSPVTLELSRKGINKGSAVKKLIEILGMNFEKTAAIGDYYNDVDMLKTVSHPACCGQAPDDIKSIVEYVACHCNKGAVADFINYIENKYIL